MSEEEGEPQVEKIILMSEEEGERQVENKEGNEEEKKEEEKDPDPYVELDTEANRNECILISH